MYSIIKNISDANITSISLADPTTPYITPVISMANRSFCRRAGLFKYDDIHQFHPHPAQGSLYNKREGQDSGAKRYSTARFGDNQSDELTGYGYNVCRAGNTPNSGWTQTTLVDISKKHKYTKNYLEQRFNQKAATSLADTTIPTNGADFVIIYR